MTAVPIFLLGATLGLLIGFFGRDAFDLLRSRKGSPRMSERKKIPVVSVVGLIALATTLVGNTLVGVLLIATRASTADYAQCSAEWQQEFGSAYRARVDAVSAVDQALDRVVFAVAERDTKAFKRAVRRYVELRDEQKQARAENPLPPLPETLCGESKEAR